jgi:hypothetical protein
MRGSFAQILREMGSIRDCLAERGGFEPPVPLGLYLGGIRPEFGALLRPNNSIRAGENLVLA